MTSYETIWLECVEDSRHLDMPSKIHGLPAESQEEWKVDLTFNKTLQLSNPNLYSGNGLAGSNCHCSHSSSGGGESSSSSFVPLFFSF